MADSLSSIDSRYDRQRTPYSMEKLAATPVTIIGVGAIDDNSPCNWPPWVSGNSTDRLRPSRLPNVAAKDSPRQMSAKQRFIPSPAASFSSTRPFMSIPFKIVGDPSISSIMSSSRVLIPSLPDQPSGTASVLLALSGRCPMLGK